MKKLVNRFFLTIFKISWVKRRWANRFETVPVQSNPFAPAPTSLGEVRLALISTAGSHHRDDQPFDMENLDGDASFRVFNHDLPQADLAITHNYYDHANADRDINCVLPLNALDTAVKEKKISSAATQVYSFMGHIQNKPLEELMNDSIPKLIEHLKKDRVTACLISPA